MMKYVYPIILTQAEEGGFLVEVPDLEIFTEGEDLANAIEMARDAISLYCVSAEDNKETFNLPTDISEIDIKEGEFSGKGKSIITLVDVDLLMYRKKHDNKTVRRNVTIPNWLNVEADQANINVSKVLQEALMEKLHLTTK